MRVLWVAPPSESRSLHVKALAGRPGYSVRAASSYADAGRVVLAEKTAIDVIVMEMETRSEDAVDFVRETKERSIYEVFRCPHFLILALGELSASLFDRFVAMKAHCLLRPSAKQLFWQLQYLERKSKREAKGEVVFRVGEFLGRPTFHLEGTTDSELLDIGERLDATANCFMMHTHYGFTAAKLAEVAGIARQSVRSYVNQIRAAYEKARIKLGIDVPADQVFVTKRRGGGYVYILVAIVLIK